MNKGVPAGFVFVIMIIVFAVKANAAAWETDFAKASQQAQKSGLYMLLYFSGSDWCHWCQKIDGEFFSSDVFKEFAGKNLICVTVDFPRYKTVEKEIKEQNDALVKKYNVHGYPKVIILSPEGELAGQTGYSKIDAKEFVGSLKKMIDEDKQNQSLKKAKNQLPPRRTDAGSTN